MSYSGFIRNWRRCFYIKIRQRTSSCRMRKVVRGWSFVLPGPCHGAAGWALVQAAQTRRGEIRGSTRRLRLREAWGCEGYGGLQGAPPLDRGRMNSPFAFVQPGLDCELLRTLALLSARTNRPFNPGESKDGVDSRVEFFKSIFPQVVEALSLHPALLWLLKFPTFFLFKNAILILLHSDVVSHLLFHCSSLICFMFSISPVPLVVLVYRCICIS